MMAFSRPLWATLLLATLFVSQASAQWDYLKTVLNTGVKEVKQKLVLDDAPVHEITTDNYRDILQDSTVDWLVLFTAGPTNCPGCEKYDKAFNDTVVLLQDRKDMHFARVDCDTQPLLCSIFSAWGATVFHITHTDEPSPSDTTPGQPLIHRTHVRTIPFHRPGSDKTVVENPDSSKEKEVPAPDPTYIEELIRKDTWKDIEPWYDYSQPFDGVARDILYGFWWGVTQFAKVPSFVSMIGISLLGRWITHRVMGQNVNKPKPKVTSQQSAAARQQANAAYAAAKKQ